MHGGAKVERYRFQDQLNWDVISKNWKYFQYFNIVLNKQGTETLDVGDALFEKIKTAPNHTLEYVAIRGKAKALESALQSNHVPAAKLLIQRTTVYEHKAEWIRSSKVW